MNGQIIGDGALRCVTTALLLKVWSVAREHGNFVGDDLVLPHNTVTDIDQISGVSGFGEAMEVVGWAVDKNGLTLPNFIEFNVPMTNSEKQKEYRERKKSGIKPVTKPLPTRSNENTQNVTTREEKRSKPPISPNGELFGDFLLRCKQNEEPPISEYQPLLSYVADVKLPMDFVQLAWYEFSRLCAEKDKMQKDWRHTFRNYVEKNYLKLWWIDDQTYELTTAGKQAKLFHGSKVAA